MTVEYRVWWESVSAGGVRGEGSRGGTLDQCRRWANRWVLDGVRAATTHARRRPVPDRRGVARRATITETRVLETVGPETIDLRGVPPEVVAAITGDPGGTLVAPVADRHPDPLPRHTDPVVSARDPQEEES